MFKPVKYIILILTLLIAQFTFAQQWFQYTNDLFEVKFPGEPKLRSKDLNTEIGMLKSHNLSYQSIENKDPNFLYSINIVEYDEGIIDTNDKSLLDSMYIATVEMLESTLKCKLEYKSNVDFYNNPALIARMSDKQSGQVVKCKLFFYDEKLFTLMVFTFQNTSLNDDIDKFLDSFYFKKG